MKNKYSLKDKVCLGAGFLVLAISWALLAYGVIVLYDHTLFPPGVEEPAQRAKMHDAIAHQPEPVQCVMIDKVISCGSTALKF